MSNVYCRAMSVLGCQPAALKIRKSCTQDCCDGENCISWFDKQFSRLAAYEDSGLSPEEVQKLKKSDASKEQCTIDQHGEIHRLRDELKRYKQAEQEGRLVVLPCKVGDTVYEPFAGKVYEKTVDRIIINRFTTPQIWIETKLPFGTSRLERWDMAFGKTVFLTREEAEKALKEACT